MKFLGQGNWNLEIHFTKKVPIITQQLAVKIIVEFYSLLCIIKIAKTIKIKKGVERYGKHFTGI